MIVPVVQFFCGETPVVHYDANHVTRVVRVMPQGKGPTYGMELSRQWKQFSEGKGMVCLEGDIAVPFEAWVELEDAIRCDTNSVIAVPYRLYPKSTHALGIYWAHRRADKSGKLAFIPGNNAPLEQWNAFALGCTYLPKRLLDAMPDDLGQWDYPRLDSLLSELATGYNIPILGTRTPAVHLHY